jgi:two-component system sensor histidine kinase/response regulator
MPLTPFQLLIVDDELPQLQALTSTLQEAGYEVKGISEPLAALNALEPGKYDLMLTDLQMPGMDGITMFREARERDPDLMVIVMTGHGTVDIAVEAMKAGAVDFIMKPFKLREIIPLIERALSLRRLRLENAELQRRVEERTTALEAANKELEAFSHSVSHDLRAPLRHISGFAAMLMAKYAPALPAEAQRYLGVIAEGAQNMSRLIDDLLTFSRTNRQPLSVQPVDMAALASNVIESLRSAQPDRKIETRVDAIPPCTGDPSLLRQVWINLLGNAFKFTGGKENALVEVGFSRESGENVYFVRDNGAGFDMRQSERLFAVFQRLHQAEEFEGTGVGLSIVQRIILRHGGRIWAQAAVGEGATFQFVLP